MGGTGWLANTKKFGDKYFSQNVQGFINIVDELERKNISVTVNTFKPEGREFNPNKMKDINGIIPKNTQPISLSKFKSKYKFGIYFM